MTEHAQERDRLDPFIGLVCVSVVSISVLIVCYQISEWSNLFNLWYFLGLAHLPITLASAHEMKVQRPWLWGLGILCVTFPLWVVLLMLSVGPLSPAASSALWGLALSMATRRVSFVVLFSGMGLYVNAAMFIKGVFPVTRSPEDLELIHIAFLWHCAAAAILTIVPFVPRMRLKLEAAE